MNPFDDPRDVPLPEGEKPRKLSKDEKLKKEKRAKARFSISNVYRFFNALIVALCGADSG